jgi:hypothetical protein
MAIGTGRFLWNSSIPGMAANGMMESYHAWKLGRAEFEAKQKREREFLVTVGAAATGNQLAQVDLAMRGVDTWKAMSTKDKASTLTQMTLTFGTMALAGRISGPTGASSGEASFWRVTTPGTPAFQLRQGESGLSVFDASKVGASDVLPSFRSGSGITSRTTSEIEASGLTIERTPGDQNLPQNLQDAHHEIRPGQGMSRGEFKKAIKGLNKEE